MNFNLWIRQSHRWVSIAFTLTVIANFAVRIWREPPTWVTYSPLAPLFLLLFSGLYLFVLPYVSMRRRKGREAEKQKSNTMHGRSPEEESLKGRSQAAADL